MLILVLVPVENAVRQGVNLESVLDRLKKEPVVTLPVPAAQVEELLQQAIFTHSVPARVVGGSTVRFSDKGGSYEWLSNLYPVEFVLNGELYRTVEHFYQAQKTMNAIEHRKIFRARKGIGARRIGRALQPRSDWNTIRDTVMLAALRLKFTHPVLALKLLATGDSSLIYSH